MNVIPKMEHYTLKQTSSSIDHVRESNNVLFYFIFIPMVRDGKATYYLTQL